jgi:hypothetical protein
MDGWLGFVLDAPASHKSGDQVFENLALEPDHCNGVPEWFVRPDARFDFFLLHDTTILKRTGNDLNLTEYVRGWKVCETKCERD